MYRLVQIIRNIVHRIPVLACQIKNMCTIVENRIGTLLRVHVVKLGQALYDNADTDLTGANNGNEILKIVYFGGSCKIIKDQPAGYGQSPVLHTVCLFNQNLHCLRMKDFTESMHRCIMIRAV